jgi:hypothetical protein
MDVADLEALLGSRAVDGTIPCATALAIARENDMPAVTVGEALDRLDIRIVSCQLGCFD